LDHQCLILQHPDLWFILNQSVRFGSGDSIKKVVGEMTLDEALEHFGFNDISSVFMIEVTEGGVDLKLPGLSSVVDTDSPLTIIKVI
jgi:hypothetical protein